MACRSPLTRADRPARAGARPETCGRHSLSRRFETASLAAPGAGARKLRRPASRPHQDHRACVPRRQRAGRDGRRDDVRSAPAARRPARQGAAAHHDEGPAAGRAGAGGHRRRGRRSIHARALALGSGDVRAHGARRVAARVGSVGWRELPVRPRPCGQLLDASRARRALWLPHREDRSGALQGLRRQQHADSAADQRGPRRRGRRAPRPPLHDRGGSGDSAISEAARSAFRPRISPLPTRSSHRTGSTPPRCGWTG